MPPSQLHTPHTAHLHLLVNTTQHAARAVAEPLQAVALAEAEVGHAAQQAARRGAHFRRDTSRKCGRALRARSRARARKLQAAAATAVAFVGCRRRRRRGLASTRSCVGGGAAFGTAGAPADASDVLAHRRKAGARRVPHTREHAAERRSTAKASPTGRLRRGRICSSQRVRAAVGGAAAKPEASDSPHHRGNAGASHFFCASHLFFAGTHPAVRPPARCSASRRSHSACGRAKPTAVDPRACSSSVGVCASAAEASNAAAYRRDAGARHVARIGERRAGVLPDPRARCRQAAANSRRATADTVKGAELLQRRGGRWACTQHRLREGAGRGREAEARRGRGA
eukprot:328591-Chlamydomonas_euryale.AAC.1